MRGMVVWVLLISLTPMAVWGLDLYVSPNGNDVNDGTQDEPLKTLQAARDVIRERTSGSGGATVWVAGGVYQFDEPLVLNAADSGRMNTPNVWRGVEGEVPQLLGGRSLPTQAFKPLNDPAVQGRLNPEAASQVVVADLKALGIEDYGKHQRYGHALAVCPAPLELYFNDAPMTLARYPNEGSILMGEIIDSGSVPRESDYSWRGGIFKYTDERHAKWSGQKDVWFQGTFGNGYADDKILVESIDVATQQVKFSRPHMYGLHSGKPYLKYKALNILDELDEPGEWWLDRSNGRLYFWPPSALENATVKISILEDPLVCFEDASHVVFRDMTVEIGRGIGIYIEGGSHVEIAGCVVRNVGTTGIFMGQGALQTVEGIRHHGYEGVPISRRVGSLQSQIYAHTTWDRRAGTQHRIQSCDVYNTGSGGIALSGGNKRHLIPGNNVVENCKIWNYNGRNRFLFSGVNIDGCGNRIAHCEISDSDFQGIYAHGNDHTYEYNEIHHVTQNPNDVSAWYLGRDPSDRGNVIRYNYFHHIGKADRMNMGIYCDDSTTDVHVYGNVFYRMNTSAGVLYSNGGWDLTMENNIIIEPLDATVVLSPQYYTWAKSRVGATFGAGGLFETRLLQDLDITKPPYSERYPSLVDYMQPIDGATNEWVGMRSRNNVLRNNVVIGGPEELVRMGGDMHVHFDDTDNLRMDTDPGFVDMANGDFTLRKDSVVFQTLPNFQAIPFNKMGLYVDAYRQEVE